MNLKWAVFSELRKGFVRSIEGAKSAVRLMSQLTGMSESAARAKLEGGRRYKSGHGICRRPPAYGPTFRYRTSRTAK